MNNKDIIDQLEKLKKGIQSEDHQITSCDFLFVIDILLGIINGTKSNIEFNFKSNTKKGELMYEINEIVDERIENYIEKGKLFKDEMRDCIADIMACRTRFEDR